MGFSLSCPKDYDLENWEISYFNAWRNNWRAPPQNVGWKNNNCWFYWRDCQAGYFIKCFGFFLMRFGESTEYWLTILYTLTHIRTNYLSKQYSNCSCLDIQLKSKNLMSHLFFSHVHKLHFSLCLKIFGFTFGSICNFILSFIFTVVSFNFSSYKGCKETFQL